MSDFWTIFGIAAAVWFFARFSGRRCSGARREQEPVRSEAEDRMSERLAEMTARLDRLEEERDFYRDLLGSGTRLKQGPEAKTPSLGTSDASLT